MGRFHHQQGNRFFKCAYYYQCIIKQNIIIIDVEHANTLTNLHKHVCPLSFPQVITLSQIILFEFYSFCKDNK